MTFIEVTYRRVETKFALDSAVEAGGRKLGLGFGWRGEGMNDGDELGLWMKGWDCS